MLFSWMPVPGTMNPDPQPVEDESEAALPRASTTLTWVVEGSVAGSRSQALALVGEDRSTAARHAVVGEQPPREPAAVQSSAAKPASSSSRRLPEHLGEPGEGRRASGRAARPEPVEQAQRKCDQHAAGRRRRIRDELVPAIRGPHGLATMTL